MESGNAEVCWTSGAVAFQDKGLQYKYDAANSEPTVTHVAGSYLHWGRLLGKHAAS